MYTLKKSLGQHFLKDEQVTQRIVAALQELPIQQLLEVGPGGGALTRYLLELPEINFKAVELDEEKVVYLRKTYPVLADSLIHESILEIPPPFEGLFTVVGNFPYNISTEIVFKVLEWREQVPYLIGMFQKEVAERLAAREGSRIYGVTSVLTQAYYHCHYLFDVPPEAFNPPPKVVSGVIRLERRPEPIRMVSDRKLSILVKTAFNQRRKTLRNAVKPLFPATALTDPLFDKRAEQLSVEEFGALTFQMT